MRILIYGATKEIAFLKLESLINNMKYGEINKVLRGRNDFIVELKNGDIYKAIGTNDTARGHKWAYAYIDATIDKELIENVIFPSFNQNGKIENSYEWY